MTDSNPDFLGQNYWRKRIEQIKQELRSADPEGRLIIPEQETPYGGAQQTPKQGPAQPIKQR